jgi:DNA replication and repair protein RecF
LIVKKIKIQGFRNLIDKSIEFSPGQNLIYGLNGAGKTSILEAIFFLGFGKSFLNAKRAEVLNRDSREFQVRMLVEDSITQHELACFFCGNRFSFMSDDKKISLMDANEIFHPVFFSSSNYDTYIQSKPFVRKLVDRFIFGVNSLYIHYILSYNKALKQKNHLLKKGKNFSGLTGWNRVLSDTGVKIMNNRINFVDKLNREIGSSFDSSLQIRYKPTMRLHKDLSVDQYFNELEKISEVEIAAHRCFKGPHLDHFEFLLNGENLKYNSSGEKKINLLKIYISFIELFKKEKKQYPVFLVDDYDTAIDSENVEFLLNHYPEMQVIATSVNKNSQFDCLIELFKEN